MDADLDSVRTFLRDLLAAAHDPPAVAGLIAERGPALDGGALRNLIDHERIGPLLHRALAGRELLSPATCAALRTAYRATAIYNLVFMRELGSCLEQFDSAGIPAIVLKGAALAEPIYGSLALRPMGDLDILVHHTDLPRVCTVVERLGFRPIRLETHAGALAEHENELAFTKPGRIRVDLDVHWSLLDSPFYQREMAMQWFWERARVQALGGLSAPALCPEALVLHLCAHLMLHHHGEGLLWWNDIAEVLQIECGAIDWDELFTRSVAYRLLLPVREVLTRLAAEWHVAIPPDALRRFTTAQPSRVEADLYAHLSDDATASERFWTDFRSIASWRERFRFARTNLLPGPAYMRERYGVRHPWLMPLYYPYRWLRGLRGVRVRHEGGSTTAKRAE